MTNSSSKPLQTLGKWYQPRNPKKIPKPAQKKIPKTISHPIKSCDFPSQKCNNLHLPEATGRFFPFLFYGAGTGALILRSTPCAATLLGRFFFNRWEWRPRSVDVQICGQY
jgi:hypothetical protein